MNPKLLTLACILALFSACGPSHVVVESPAPAPPPPPPPAEVSYQTFYDELSPYGNWINYPGYGYVWMPNAGPGFKPYATNGHWVYTDQGWTWNSGYNWGWAPFHYGRWFFDQSYGWMWIPGYEWSPAWVSWRTNSDYYGWAPLSPGISVSVAFSNYSPPTNYWCFVPHQYVTSPSINNYYVNETKNVNIIHNTTVINNNVTVNNYNNTNINNRTNVTVNNGGRNPGYAAGPDPNEVGRYTGSEVHPVALRASTRPGGSQLSNGQMNIYRPAVNNAPAGSTAQQTMAPSRVQSLRDMHPNNGNGQGNTGNPREENGNAWGAQENGRSNDNGNNYGNRNLPGNGRTSGGTNREEEGNANGARDNNHSSDNGNNAANQQGYGRPSYSPASGVQGTPTGNMSNNANPNANRSVNPAQTNQNNQAAQGSRTPQNGYNANPVQNNNNNNQGSVNRQPSATANTGYQNGRGGQGYKPPVNNPGNGQRVNQSNQHPAGNAQTSRNNAPNHQQQNPNKKPENNPHSN